MVKVAERISGVAAYQLPSSLSREIGRILVRFAYFEQYVLDLVWQALKLSETAGRIAVRDPRVTDRLDMLRDIINERGGTLDEELRKSIRQRADLLAARRHMLAHGIWFYHKTLGQWYVQLTRGSWPITEQELVTGSKKTTPEHVLMTVDVLRSTTAEIDELIADLKRLRLSAYDAPPSSPEISP